MISAVARSLADYREQISQCERQYSREPGSVRLLAVSKEQSIEKVIAAIEAGQCAFGENYVQEALPKIQALAKTYPQIEWHFIGQMQRNKTRKVAEQFAWVHSVDSPLLAKRLSEQRPANLPPLNICLEVKMSEEQAKGGVPSSEIKQLAEYCQGLPRLRLRGLMAIPLRQEGFSVQRQAFHEIWYLWDKLRRDGINMDTLSMGMTNDFVAAIAEGATIVRIGAGIFGQRG